jgi:flagellar motor protein MotB
MSATGEVRPIIIKRKKVIDGGGHHGGAWKVAYADFVTAMMAFFLLMWLLNATSEDQRKGLADYFNPTLPISRTSAGGAGMLEGKAIFGEDAAAGTVPEGAPPKPTHQDDGPPLGDDEAVPDLPPDVVPGEFAANAGADVGAETSMGEATAGLESGDTEAVSLKPAEAEAQAAEQAEQARLEAVGRQVAEAMHEAEDGALERHFFLRITPDGLVIEIIDADDQPLFASASAEPAPILRHSGPGAGRNHQRHSRRRPYRRGAVWQRRLFKLGTQRRPGECGAPAAGRTWPGGGTHSQGHRQGRGRAAGSRSECSAEPAHCHYTAS